MTITPVHTGCPRIVLFPGMGADARLFDPQRTDGLSFDTPALPVPESDEDLPGYAKRVRAVLDLDSTCVFGGVSFGGMLACELAHLCQARKVILIASCRSPSALRRFYRSAEWFSRLLPDSVIRQRCVSSCRLLARQEELTHRQYQLLREMTLATPIPFFRRVSRMILGWEGRTVLPCPVHHIHGSEDRIIPRKGVEPDEVIEGGGHLINLTHADPVNDFIQRALPDGDRPAILDS